MAYPPMHRIKRQMTPKDAEALLRRCGFGVLALVTPGGDPYAVPVNYLWHEGRAYFHSATVGLKMDSLRANPRVSLCVTAEHDVVPEKFSTAYRSVVVLGAAREVTQEADKREILALLSERLWEQSLGRALTGGERAAVAAKVAGCPAQTAMVAIEPESVTGKFGYLLS